MGDPKKYPQMQPKIRRKSLSSPARDLRDPIKRRSSSFANSTSPWYKRNSLLSSAMVQNENFSVYESSNFFDSSSYNIISLRECQGFVFNQDLFASPYQQSQSIAKERKYRALSVSKSRSASSSIDDIQPVHRRRHTTHHDTRSGIFATNENAIADDDESFSSDNRSSMLMDGDTSAVVDEYDEYEEDDYGHDSSSRKYKICVTEIVVNENDNSIYPE